MAAAAVVVAKQKLITRSVAEMIVACSVLTDVFNENKAIGVETITDMQARCIAIAKQLDLAQSHTELINENQKKQIEASVETISAALRELQGFIYNPQLKDFQTRLTALETKVTGMVNKIKDIITTDTTLSHRDENGTGGLLAPYLTVQERRALFQTNLNKAIQKAKQEAKPTGGRTKTGRFSPRNPNSLRF